jgi:hypothetical protein
MSTTTINFSTENTVFNEIYYVKKSYSELILRGGFEYSNPINWIKNKSDYTEEFKQKLIQELLKSPDIKKFVDMHHARIHLIREELERQEEDCSSWTAYLVDENNSEMEWSDILLTEIDAKNIL